MFKKSALVLTIVATLGLSINIATTFATTSAGCNFTRDLQTGSVGADVKCLQQYLNNHNVVIAPSGPGSPGFETTRFGALTRAAVITWQKKNNITPAVGYFGTKSRAAFAAMGGGTMTSPVNQAKDRQSSAPAALFGTVDFAA